MAESTIMLVSALLPVLVALASVQNRAFLPIRCCESSVNVQNRAFLPIRWCELPVNVQSGPFLPIRVFARGVGNRRCNAKFSEQCYVGLSDVEGRAGCAARQNRRTAHGETEKSALQVPGTGVTMRREFRVGGARGVQMVDIQ